MRKDNLKVYPDNIIVFSNDQGEDVEIKINYGVWKLDYDKLNKEIKRVIKKDSLYKGEKGEITNEMNDLYNNIIILSDMICDIEDYISPILSHPNPNENNEVDCNSNCTDLGREINIMNNKILDLQKKLKDIKNRIEL